jgi:hypothetical protein
MDTTLRVYKKQITPQGLLAGMQQFQNSLGKQQLPLTKAVEAVGLTPRYRLIVV